VTANVTEDSSRNKEEIKKIEMRNIRHGKQDLDLESRISR
jgi:hypothetical protein